MTTSVTSLTRFGGSPPKAAASRVLIIFGALGIVAFVIWVRTDKELRQHAHMLGDLANGTPDIDLDDAPTYRKQARTVGHGVPKEDLPL